MCYSNLILREKKKRDWTLLAVGLGPTQLKGWPKLVTRPTPKVGERLASVLKAALMVAWSAPAVGGEDRRGREARARRHCGEPVLGVTGESGLPTMALHDNGGSKKGVGGDSSDLRSRRPIARSRSYTGQRWSWWQRGRRVTGGGLPAVRSSRPRKRMMLVLEIYGARWWWLMDEGLVNGVTWAQEDGGAWGSARQ
jgi:hypothetical protein